jgi:hypothetical protein
VMWQGMQASTPRLLQPGQWHLPFIDAAASEAIREHVLRHDGYRLDVAIRVSVARCARVSYRGHDGQPTSVKQDLELYGRLAGAAPMHVSPAEHQATPDPDHERPDLWGNFVGWIQFRKTLPGECR